MGADDHRLLGVGACAFEHADDVLGRDPLAADLDGTVDHPTFEKARPGLEVGIDLFFQLLERRLARRGQDLIDVRPCDREEWDRRVSLRARRLRSEAPGPRPFQAGRVVDQEDRDGPVLEGVGGLVREGGVLVVTLPANGLFSSSSCGSRRMTITALPLTSMPA